jgi:hypothetical protein
MVAAEAGVSTTYHQRFFAGKFFLKVIFHLVYLRNAFCHYSCNLEFWAGGNRAIKYRKKCFAFKVRNVVLSGTSCLLNAVAV